MLTADVDDAFGNIVLRSKLTGMFIDDRFFQLFDSADRCVFRKVGLNGANAGLLYVFGGWEIGLAGAVVHDIDTLIAQFDGSFHYGLSLRYVDTRNSSSQVHDLWVFLGSLFYTPF